MKTLIFSVFLCKSVLSITLLVHVFLSDVLTAPTVDHGHFRNIRHSHSHNSVPAKGASSFQGTEAEHLNHKREQTPDETTQPQPIVPNPSDYFKVSTNSKEGEGINPAGSSNNRNELEEKSIPHFHFSSNQKEPVDKKQSQSVDSDQNKEEKQKQIIDARNRLQNVPVKPPNLPAYNLDDYYVNEEDGIEARLSTATLIPDVQFLLQKNKESPHLDSIPDYSHLEFPKDTTETQIGSRTNLKHVHGLIFNIKNPVDSSIGRWSPRKFAAPPTTVKPITPKPIVQSETKILLNGDVIQMEHPNGHERNGTFNDLWNKSISSKDKKVMPEARNVTVPVKHEPTSSVPFIVVSKTVENRFTVKEEQKTKAGVIGDSGSNTVIDYPVDYLALDDYDIKELKSVIVSTTAKIQKQLTIRPQQTPIPSTKARVISNVTTISPVLIALEDSKIASKNKNSSVFLIDTLLDTVLRPPNNNTKTTMKLLDAELESSSEENNRIPISGKESSVKLGTNSTSTETTQIDIILEIRAPSISQPNPSSRDLKQLEQTFSVPLGKRYVHHNHTTRADSQ